MSQSASIRVSIAMATYNGAAYLQEQLDSFVAQTRLPDELVITDDCSTDKTLAIIERFAKNAPFEVRWEKNEKNLGYCGNFNAALMKTTGDLVFLSDQDDVWFPEKIEFILSVADKNPEALVVMNDAVLTDCDLHEVGLTKIGQIRSAGFSMESFVMGCCCAIRRELLDMCLPIPNGYKAHDNWIVAIAGGLNAKIIDNNPLQFYRRHEANESQFIANRAETISRVQVFFHTIKNISSAGALAEFGIYREQLLLMLQGIHKAQGIAADKYQAPLKKFQHTTEDRLTLLEKRMQVRQKSLLPRAVGALHLWSLGCYRDASGVKSMVRDIFG